MTSENRWQDQYLVGEKVYFLYDWELCLATVVAITKKGVRVEISHHMLETHRKTIDKPDRICHEDELVAVLYGGASKYGTRYWLSRTHAAASKAQEWRGNGQRKMAIQWIGPEIQ